MSKGRNLRPVRLSGEIPRLPVIPLLPLGRGVEGRVHLLALLGLGTLGFFLAAGGSIALPVGSAVSWLWPAVSLQFALALWFGWPGVLAAVLFPFFSNLLVADLPTALAFTPANFLQAASPLVIFQTFRGHIFCRRIWDLVTLAFASLVASGLGAVVGISLQKALLGGAAGGNLPMRAWFMSNVLLGFSLTWPMLRWVSPVLWGLRNAQRLGKGLAFGWYLVGGTFTLVGGAVATVIAIHLLSVLGFPDLTSSLPGILGVLLLPLASGGMYLLWRKLAEPLDNLVQDTELAHEGAFPKTPRGPEPAELTVLRQRFSEVVATLAEEQRRFKDLFLTLGEPVLLVDPQGKLLDANPTFERVFQVPLPAIRGRNLLAFTDRDSRAKLATLLQGEPPPSPVVVRGRVRSGGGGFRQVHMTVAPWRDSGGAFAGYCVVTTDITREEQEAQRAAVAAKLASLQHLLAGLAHEGNNVLQAATTGLEALALAHQDLAPRLQELRQALNRGKVLIETVTFLSGNLDRFPTETFSAQELFLGLSQVASAYPEKTLNWVAPVAYPRIKGHRTLLRRGVEELARNALEASQPSASVTVALRKTHLPQGVQEAALGPGDYLVVEVRDQGHGIRLEHLPFIFDPFFTTRERTTHQGVGLSLARAAARHAGGDLTLESPPGGGTVARLWLPVVQEQTARPAPASLAKTRVLLVDDDRHVLQALRESLSLLGMEVRALEGGEEALALAFGEPFDVVLLDLLMPGISGFEVLGKLRAQRLDLPVILSSGYAPDDRVREALQQPRTFYLQKPYTLGQLEEVLKLALEA